MNRNFGDILSRVSTGATAFVCAGVLIHGILADNGGDHSSQAGWENARSNGIAVSGAGAEVRDVLAELETAPSVLDQILTGSIEPIEQSEGADPKPDVSRTVEEPSVLSIIRENADIVPSVSSGTDRISVTVKKGDTLFSIAKRHGLRVAELAGLNGLSEPYVIKIGQTLYVAR